MGHCSLLGCLRFWADPEPNTAQPRCSWFAVRWIPRTSGSVPSQIPETFLSVHFHFLPFFCHFCTPPPPSSLISNPGHLLSRYWVEGTPARGSGVWGFGGVRPCPPPHFHFVSPAPEGRGRCAEPDGGGVGGVGSVFEGHIQGVLSLIRGVPVLGVTHPGGGTSLLVAPCPGRRAGRAQTVSAVTAETDSTWGNELN